MSLINDVLRNLEDKRPDDLARHKLQREIRPLPGGSSRSARWVKLTVVFGAALVLLAVALMHAAGRLTPLFERVLVDAPPPVAAPVAVPVVAVPPAPPPIESQPSVAAVNGENTAIFQNMRLASELTNVPMPMATQAAPPEPLVAATPAKPGKVEPVVAVVEAAKPAPAPAPAQLPAAASGPVRIEKNPVLATPRDRAEAEYRKAEAAQSAGHLAEVLEALRAALKIDPGYLPARQALLRRLLETRKIDEAMTVLQEGLAEQPAQSGWAMALARLQLEQGDLAAADRTLARSQPYAEANAEYAGFQGHLKSRLGAQPMAIGHYQRATRLAPGEGRWWLGLGLALEADGQLPEAKEAFRRSRASGTLSSELAAIAEQHLR